MNVSLRLAVAVLAVVAPSVARADDPAPADVPARRPIQVFEKKQFLEIGKIEAAPEVGLVTNDPFVRRYLLGAAGAYHVSEVLAVEGRAEWSPDLGEADYTALSKTLIEENHVSPDISKIEATGSLSLVFAPISGKIAAHGHIVRFDVFGDAGPGVVFTHDDLKALQVPENSPQPVSTENQWHPTTNLGFGLRAMVGHDVAFRVDGRALTYIETVDGTTLEMKNNFVLSAGASFFFGGRPV